MDWQVVEGLASSVTAVLAVVAIFLGVRELRFRNREIRALIESEEKQRDEVRAARYPYLRVDLGLHPDDGIDQGVFVPPPVGVIYRPSDFGLTFDVPGDLRPLAPPHDGAVRLVLWATNLQSQSLGFAYRVEIDVVYGWGPDATQAKSVRIEFAYIAPLTSTAIEIMRIRRDVEDFTAAISGARYWSIDISAPAQEGYHGANRFWYSVKRGIRHARGLSFLPERFPGEQRSSRDGNGRLNDQP